MGTTDRARRPPLHPAQRVTAGERGNATHEGRTEGPAVRCAQSTSAPRVKHPAIPTAQPVGHGEAAARGARAREAPSPPSHTHRGSDCEDLGFVCGFAARPQWAKSAGPDQGRIRNAPGYMTHTQKRSPVGCNAKRKAAVAPLNGVCVPREGGVAIRLSRCAGWHFQAYVLGGRL